ncbi:dTMP kinase [Leptolyngbya sp. FACHB-541]|uniref:dTMP kinase n=1 Tax=Leptolyngbya sp. FACHB-541 TaxID=2692810 RepID=UPI001682EE23|nr:dTMP kinase [Leptolyngbya sp. FACHB-541]MBD1999384.1 dTMP kinase [Leptolyngbya sp. FACHB-541]
MQGKLIVFEGVEGSGKTTQLQRSQSWLLDSPWFNRLQTQGYISHLVVTRQPGGTDLGQAIRQLLLHSAQSPIQDRAELLLYAADRAQHVEESLRPQLQQGALILCDRYTDSTVAYQGYGRGLDLNLIQQLNQVATGGLESNLTLWFDLDVEQGLARTKLRGTADRIEQDSLAFHQRVQQGFTELARANPNRIVRIDASRSEAEVSEQVQAVLQRWLMQWYPALLLHS